MGARKRIAPIFPVRDLTVSLGHYRRLGFATREYGKGGYGYVTRDGIEIHLGVVPHDRTSTPAGNIIRFGSPLRRPDIDG
jgi:hypothetical protein